MIKIIEHTVDLDFPAGKGVHTLIAQVPTRLHLEGRLFKINDKMAQTARTMSVLRIASCLSGNEKLHFILLPESSVPFDTME